MLLSQKKNDGVDPSIDKVHYPIVPPVLFTKRQNVFPEDIDDDDIVLPAALDSYGDTKDSMDGYDVKDNKPLSWKTSNKRSTSSTLGTRSSTTNIIKEKIEKSKDSIKERRMPKS